MKIMNNYPKWLSLSSFILLIVLMSALYMPMLYRKVFFKDIEKTHLFYSPVSHDFIFTEKVVGKIPEAVSSKSEDHHAELAYKEVGKDYISRVEFEKLLPFIYYKNMEIWGKLPLQLEGQLFDKKIIKQNRRVIELKSKEVVGHSFITPVFPLLESNPRQARLVFPEDRFWMTQDSMEFINADFNEKDENLTKIFTQALKENGFIFPARSVNGKFTVLKPFDEGIFLVDQKYQIFHVKRVDGKPKVIKTPIDPGLKTRCIKISENRQKKHYGILLGEDDRVFLICYDQYKLIPIPMKGYDPDTMDLKLIFNPLYCTALFSDSSIIHGLAMDNEFNIVKEYSHTMSRASITPANIFYKILFPFVINWEDESSEFISVNFLFNGWFAAMGMAFCFFIYGFWCFFVVRKPPSVAKTVLVGMFGIYGIVALNLTGMEI